MNVTPYTTQTSHKILSKIFRNHADTAYVDIRLINEGDCTKHIKRIAQMVTANSTRTYMGFISIKGNTPAYRHAVALIIKPTDQTIAYLDPKGKGVPHYMKRELSRHLPNYSLCDTNPQQQYDDLNCAVITIDNLEMSLQNQRLQAIPDTNALRTKHRALIS